MMIGFPFTSAAGYGRVMRSALPPGTPEDITVTVRACAYLRMSSDQQAGSIEQQREALAVLAGRCGYEVVAEYVDEGISGRKTNRPGWLRLLAESGSGDWSVVLLWDVARLGRV